MRKKVVLVLLVCSMVIGVYASGGKESNGKQEAYGSFLLGDASSDDAILRHGLPKLADTPVNVDYLTIWTSGVSADAEELWLTKEIPVIYPNVSVEIERLGTNPLKEAATIRVIAGTPPTMARISGGYAIDELVNQGLLKDVSSTWETYHLEDLVSESLANAFKFNGKYYGFPFSDAPQALLFWNKDAFTKANVPQPPYATWDAFFDAAKIWHESYPTIPFYTYSLNSGWYALERAFVQAATKFGKAYIFRIYNGEASEQDYKDLLTFNKQLIAVSNKDYVSLEGTKGVQDLVIHGDAGLCYSGSWGYAAFTKAGITEGKNLGYSLLPGYPMHFSTMSGLVVFAKSGKELAGEMIGVHSMLKTVQSELNKKKDNLPARNDIELSASDGWSNLVAYVSQQIKYGAEVIPRANTGFPSTILSSMEPLFVSCMTGSSSVDETAHKMFEIQEQNKEKFRLIRWK